MKIVCDNIQNAVDGAAGTPKRPQLHRKKHRVALKLDRPRSEHNVSATKTGSFITQLVRGTSKGVKTGNNNLTIALSNSCSPFARQFHDIFT